MDLESIILSEISQIETNAVCYQLNVESGKKNEWIYQNWNWLTNIENKLVVIDGEREGGRGKIGAGD